MWRTRAVLLALLTPFVIVIGVTSAVRPANAASEGLQPGPGQYHGARVRVLSNASITAGATVSVKVTGVGTIPDAGVSTVAVNLAVKGATGRGRVRVFPSELTDPTLAETAFYRNGVWDDYLIMVKVGDDGYIKLRNPAAVAVNVYADIHGYFRGTAGATPGATYVPLPTSRVVSNQTVPANGTASFTFSGLGGIPATQVAFVAFTLIVKSTGTGKATVYPSGTSKPTGSNIDYRPSDFMSNLAIVAPGADGKITFNNEGSAALTVFADVSGYFATPQSTVAGAAGIPVTPRRLLAETTIAAGATQTVAPLGQLGVPATGVDGVGVVVSASNSTAAGLLRIHPTGQSGVPGGGSLSYWGTGVDTWYWHNFVPVKLGPDGTFVVANRGSAPVTVTVDTFMYFRSATNPSPPTGVTAKAGDGRATVSWTPATDGGAAITGYRVTASPGGAAVSVAAAERTATVAGLTNGTSYTFTVTATNAVGPSSPSAASPPVMPGRVPSAPTNVVATAADAVASVRWTEPADPGSNPVTGYTVTETTTGRRVNTTGETAALFTGLENGATYTFRVVATNPVGDSAASAASNPVTPRRLPAPGRPVITDLRPRDGEVELSWAPPDTGGQAVTTYRVTVQPPGRTIETTTTGALVTGLTNDAAYTFTVTAVNANGAGPASLPAEATPRPARVPLAPTVTQVLTGNGRIDVRWMSTRDGGSPVTSYRLSAEPGGTAVTTAADATGASLTGLTNGTAYTVKLVAVNKAGPSAATVTENVTPVARRAPAPPGDITAAAAGTGVVEVGWTPTADPGTSTVTRYTVSAQPGGASVTSTSCAGDQKSCVATIGGLDASKEYTFTVTATSADGTSTASEVTGPVRPWLSTRAEAWELTTVAAQTLTAVDQDGRLMFDNPPAEVTDLTAGRYLIVPPTAAAPDGLLRKITKVDTQGSRTTLSTVEAALGDLIADGDFTGNVTLDSDDLAGAPAASATTAGEVSGPPIPFHLQMGIGKTGRVEADLALTPVLRYNLRIRGSVVTGRVALINRLTGHVVVHTSRGEDWTKEFSLGRSTFQRLIKLGKVRVPITVSSVLTARAHADASGSVTLEGSPRIDSGIEARLEGWRTSWTPVFEEHSVALPPVIDGTASARLEVTSGHFVSLAGTIGIGQETAPYLAATADVAGDPWWWIRAGVVLRGCVSLFDECTPTAASRDLYVTINSADGPFRGISINPSRATVARGQTVDFDVVTHNAAAAPVTWQIVAGPGTIDSNGIYTSSTVGRAVIRAVRSGGGIDDPDAEAVVDVEPGRPGAPVDVRANAAPLSAQISWQPPPDNLVSIAGYVAVATPLSGGGPEVTGYAEASARTLSLRDMTPGIAYAVQVYAYSANGTGPPSDAVTVTPLRGILPEGDAVNVAVDANGAPDHTRYAGWGGPNVSADGRYVFFTTVGDSNLVPPEAHVPGSDASYLLRKDMYTGELELVSRGLDGHTPVPILGYTVGGDGTRVAYTTDGSYDLIVLDIGGTDNRLVFDGTSTITPWPGGLSDDGEIVLYAVETRTTQTTQRVLWWQQRDGATKAIFSGPYAIDGEMSAEGDRVTLVNKTNLDGTEWTDPDRYREQVLLLATDTGTQRVVAQSIHNGDPTTPGLFSAFISPDGTTVGYRRSTNGPGSHIYEPCVVNLVNDVPGTPRCIADGEWADAMSDDGRFIALSKMPPENLDHGYQGAVYDMDAGASVPTTGGTTDLSYDGTAGVSALMCAPYNTTGCANGVWYQRYDVPSRHGSMANCNDPDYGFISDEYQRRTGIRVKLCDVMPKGTGAKSSIKPPGWPAKNEHIPGSGEWRYARGHLLAAQLGGSGSQRQNLVTLYQLANREVMDPEEDKVAAAVKAGENVYYYVTPVYSDSYPDLDDRMPDNIHIVARGDDGFFLDACIPNVEHVPASYEVPCTA